MKKKNFLKAATFWLVGKYPQSWQNRYREEFLALLEDYPLSWKVFFNVLWGAVQAHLSKPKKEWQPGRYILSRIVFVLLIGLAASLLTWWFARDILGLLGNLAGTYEVGPGIQSHLISTGIIPTFFYYFLIAFYGGTLLTSPFAIWFFLGYLANRRLSAGRSGQEENKRQSGLIARRKKKSFFFLSIPLLTVCWAGGVCFSYLVEIPATVKMLLSFSPVIAVESFIPLVTKMAFVTGLLFEIPAFFFLLGAFRFVALKKLKLWWSATTLLSVLSCAILLPSFDQLSLALATLIIFGLNSFGIFLLWTGNRLFHPREGEIATN